MTLKQLHQIQSLSKDLSDVDRIASIVNILYSADIYNLSIEEGKSLSNNAVEALEKLNKVVPADVFQLVDKLGTLTFGHYVDLQQTREGATEAEVVAHTLAVISTSNKNRAKDYPKQLEHYWNVEAEEALAQAGFFTIIGLLISNHLEILKLIQSLPSQEQAQLINSAKATCLKNGDITALSTLCQVETYLKKKQS